MPKKTTMEYYQDRDYIPCTIALPTEIEQVLRLLAYEQKSSRAYVARMLLIEAVRALQRKRAKDGV
jgi:hypothetical protein